MADIVPQHEQQIHVIVVEELPAHKKRTTSPLFRKNRRLLIKDHGLGCFNPSCKTPYEKLEVHHILEWCGWEWYDMERVKKYLLGHDFYGFSKLYIERPITDPADIRNLIVLCAQCHREDDFAIHRVPWPQHAQQAVVRDGHSFEGMRDHMNDHSKKH